MENLGGVHRKLPHLFSAKRFFHQAGGSGPVWWVSGASIAANDREMASDLSCREASGDRTMLPLQTKRQANGISYKTTIDTGATASFVSEEMTDNSAALGRITRRQVRWADGRCGGINAQLEMEVEFGNKQYNKSLLILHGVAIRSSRSTGKRVGRYYSVPGNRAGKLQHNDGNIKYGRAPDQNE